MVIVKVWILWYYITGILKCYTQLDVVQKIIHSFSELLILKYVNLWFSKLDFDNAQSGAKHWEAALKTDMSLGKPLLHEQSPSHRTTTQK